MALLGVPEGVFAHRRGEKGLGDDIRRSESRPGRLTTWAITDDRTTAGIAYRHVGRLSCHGPGCRDRFPSSPARKGLPLMEVLACLNGETMPVEQARVPVWDRGFLFGDAVYEVFRMYRGRCWLEAEHFARLRRSLKELDFPPYDSTAHRADVSHDRGERDPGGDVYVQITRGVAPRSHAFPDPPVPPTELIVVRPYDDGPAARLREPGVAVISHPDLRWKRCDIKSTNLLANFLANEAARRAGCYEAILVDSAGFVTEATHSSVLWVRQGRLEGTPEGHEILPGMTRQLVLRLARSLGIPFGGTHVTLPNWSAADEVILVGTTIEVLPVVRIDGKTIGSGASRSGGAAAWDAYRQEVERWLARPAQTVSYRPPSPGGRMSTSEPRATMPRRPVRRPLPPHSIASRSPMPGSGSSCSPTCRSSGRGGRSRRWSIRSRRWAGRSSRRIVPVAGSDLSCSLLAGLEGGDLPAGPGDDRRGALDRGAPRPASEGIDHCDHVVGRRPAGCAATLEALAWRAACDV